MKIKIDRTEFNLDVEKAKALNVLTEIVEVTNIKAGERYRIKGGTEILYIIQTANYHGGVTSKYLIGGREGNPFLCFNLSIGKNWAEPVSEKELIDYLNRNKYSLVP